MKVGSHPAARIDPGLDVEDLAAVFVGGSPEAVSLAENRIFDYALCHLASVSSPA
jgi:hypothetical protein